MIKKIIKIVMLTLLFFCLFKADEVDSEMLNGVLSESVPHGPKPVERGLSRSQHITVTRVQLRHPRRLPSRPVSLPADQKRVSRGQVDENNTRNRADQDERRGVSCSQSIEEVDETETAKSRAGAHYRSTFIDTQTLRRTWDKQYKHEISSKTVKIVAASSTESTAVDDSSASSPASSSSVFSLETTGSSISTIYPSKPYTVTVRPGRTLKREDNVSKSNPVTKALRAPRTLQPPPGTFYKPPSESKTKTLQNCASANSAEEEDEEEDEEDEDEEELGIEIEVSVDDPVEEDAEAEQAAVSQSPSSSPEELGQSQTKPVYQRLRSRCLQEVEHREAHFV